MCLLFILHQTGSRPVTFNQSNAAATETTPKPLRERISGNFPRWHLELPLIGRDDDLANVRALVKDNRATAILGLGGVGKTRLAAQIADQADFADRVLWHTIAPYTTVDQLAGQVRDHLDLDKTLDDDATWATLGSRAVLIVLDNAEDCAQPKAYADRINGLNTIGGTRILMTSRNLWREIRSLKTRDLRAPSAEDAVKILEAMAAQEPPTFPIAGQEAALAKAARFHPRLMQKAVGWLNFYPADYVLEILTTLQGADAEEALDDMIRKTMRQVEAQPGGAAAIAALRKLAACRGGFTFAAAKYILSALNPQPLLPQGEGEQNNPSPHARLSRSQPLPQGEGEREQDIPTPTLTQSFAASPLHGEGSKTDMQALGVLMQWKLVGQEGGRYVIDPLVTVAVEEDETARRAHYEFYLALAREHDAKQDYLGLDVESANLEAAFEWAMGEDAEAAYWFYYSCSNFLANRGRFLQRMDWLERAAAALLGSTDEELKASVQNSLGILYQNHPLGDRRDNLRKAITAYGAALEHYTPERAPLDYATSQNNLGNAYCDLAEIEDREENLRLAIAAYEAALAYRMPERAPLDYAGTQNNLGTAYGNLAEIEDREGNLRLAIAAYEAALAYRTPERAPLDYAGTQNNLGIAYQNLAEIEDKEGNLRLAIAVYEAALEY
jgi:tetratricopeptide (TPR) repeat protein